MLLIIILEGIALFDADASWGWDTFISHENLLTSELELLPDDKLTVNCEVSLAGRTDGDLNQLNFIIL